MAEGGGRRKEEGGRREEIQWKWLVCQGRTRGCKTRHCQCSLGKVQGELFSSHRRVLCVAIVGGRKTTVPLFVLSLFRYLR